MKLNIFLFICAFAYIYASPLVDLNEPSWLNFKITHGKTYPSIEEEKLRLSIYKDNLEKIAEHNARYAIGEESYFLKENQFADLTHSEFVENYLSKPLKLRTNSSRLLFQASDKKLPKTQDWRKQGAVTPIKNQGQCGSCWAFSATGSIEGQTKLKKNKLISVSEQQLVDCSDQYGNLGCSGGLMDSAFNYIIDNDGIDTEESYPYEESDGRCRFNKKNVGARLQDFVDIPVGSEKALQQAVATVGPVSVAIDASQFSFQLYGGGIYNEARCSATLLDHGVLAIGYGSENDRDYWLVKNSWGTTWGTDGYIRMSRNKNNQCGIATQASYPILA